MKIANSINVLTTEYRQEFKKRKLRPVDRVLRPDCFNERIKDYETDPKLASVTTEIDDAVKELVRKYRRDNIRSVYEVSYKNPWDLAGSKEEHDVHSGRELLAYIRKLYSEHDENVLALPVTAKRILGYTRSEFLHGGLTTYQNTYGRVGGRIMLESAEDLIGRRKSGMIEVNDGQAGKMDFCQESTLLK